MKAYEETLRRISGIGSWVLGRARVTEQQRYLLADSPEAERAVEREFLTVTVLVDHDGWQGRNTFTLFGKDPKLEPARVEEAIFRARLEANEPYALPTPEPMAVVQAKDDELARDPRRSVDAVQERLFAALAKEKGARLSSSEIFLTRTESEIRTSTGVAGTQDQTDLSIELVMLAGESGKESESAGSYQTRRLGDLDVERIVARHATWAKDTLVAELPASRTSPMVITGRAFVPLLQPFQVATSGQAIYHKYSPLAVGGALLGDRKVDGDVVTLSSDPTLAFGAGSRAFDDEGLSLKRTAAIDQGVFRTIVTSKRYADYLGVPATGDWQNQVLAPGTASMDELLSAADGPIVHVVAFSWLNPDGLRGGFSTEIRLGYEMSAKGTRVIKGGSVAGNVYDLFTSVRLARETELQGDYFGPKGLRFSRVQVAGA